MAGTANPVLRSVLAGELGEEQSFPSDDGSTMVTTGKLEVADAAYYAGKLAQERLVEASALPHTIARAAQFHEFAGQIIARMVQRHYGIDPAGLNFYHFEQIPKPKPYKDAYRAALDSLEVDEPTRLRILDAAVDSFELNRRVIADLGAARAPEHAAAGAPT